MPFVPHTEADVASMLADIGAPSIDALFDEIPPHLANGQLDQVPAGMSEMALLQLMQQRASQDEGYTCYMGAGSYDHHIPAAVWDLTSRGEFMTAYTPYQAEASQGTLQLIYEYQSMMTALTAMDVSNASVYDGASGMAEAMLMAVRANKKNKSGKVLVAESVHPNYTKASKNIVTNQGLELCGLPIGSAGCVDTANLDSVLEQFTGGEVPAAIVIAQPNFFGCFEQVDQLTDWAHAMGSLVIAVTNPMSLAVLAPPGEWGATGADIVCGDGQPFGVPMASGGPSFGFICARQSLVRQMPGRIIGRTEDLDGKIGYALTLQAREQHIRRGKATSNICTNQGLLVTAGTIYLSLMGPQGLADVAGACHQNASYLCQQLLTIDGVEMVFDEPFFHEFALRFSKPAAHIISEMMTVGILPGLDLGDFVASKIDGAENVLLIAVTEKRTQQEMDQFVECLRQVLAGQTLQAPTNSNPSLNVGVAL